MRPPIAQDGAVLQFFLEDIQRLMEDVAVIGKGGVIRGGFWEQGQEAAFAARWWILQVMLQFFQQLAEFRQ